MEALHGVINDINSFLWTYIIIVALIGIGIIFTLRTKFPCVIFAERKRG